MRDYAELKPYQVKPKYTQKEIDLIRLMLEANQSELDIIYVLKKERPDVSLRSFERWIAREKRAIDTLAQR